MSTERITIDAISTKLDSCLELYNYMSAVTVTIKEGYSDCNLFTPQEVLKMYGDQLDTWLYYQSRLQRLEHYEVCAKIKRLLDYEQRDCEIILEKLKYKKTNQLKTLRKFYENKHL